MFFNDNNNTKIGRNNFAFTQAFRVFFPQIQKRVEELRVLFGKEPQKIKTALEKDFFQPIYKFLVEKSKKSILDTSIHSRWLYTTILKLIDCAAAADSARIDKADVVVKEEKIEK